MRHQARATPRTLAADTGYGKAEFLAWLESQDIASYIPLREHFASTSGNAFFSLDRFTYRPESNSFECPEGKQLKYIGIKPAVNKSYIYRSTEAKCRECPVKSECTSGRYKQIVIHVEEAVRQRARDRTREAALFQHQRSRRKIEALFGELKKQNRTPSRSTPPLKHVREQFLMAAAARTSSVWCDTSHRDEQAMIPTTRRTSSVLSTPEIRLSLPAATDFFNSYFF